MRALEALLTETRSLCVYMMSLWNYKSFNKVYGIYIYIYRQDILCFFKCWLITPADIPDIPDIHIVLRSDNFHIQDLDAMAPAILQSNTTH